MTDTLPVHVNRGELHGLDVPNGVTVTGPFDVVLQNHGESVHVHLHLDDALSEVAALEANNHHVESESTRRVHVDVAGTGPVRGKLKVVTAYGATTRYVDIELEEPREEANEVTVDDSLSQPQPRDTPAQNRSARSEGFDLAVRPELAVLVLGALALLMAFVATLVLNNTAVLLGSLAVLTGVLVAIYLLVE